jgi:hypothetical protein
MSEVITRLPTNIKLIDFHHNLLSKYYNNIPFKNYSDWFHKFKNPNEYYFYFLLNFVAHGIYFELFNTADNNREKSFINQNVILNIKKIKSLTGLDPIIVKLYPDNQTDEEDFYWFSYPTKIEEDIINIVNNT